MTTTSVDRFTGAPSSTTTDRFSGSVSSTSTDRLPTNPLINYFRAGTFAAWHFAADHFRAGTGTGITDRY